MRLDEKHSVRPPTIDRLAEAIRQSPDALDEKGGRRNTLICLPQGGSTIAGSELPEAGAWLLNDDRITAIAVRVGNVEDAFPKLDLFVCGR